jgi:hypothetical protein
MFWVKIVVVPTGTLKGQVTELPAYRNPAGIDVAVNKLEYTTGCIPALTAR